MKKQIVAALAGIVVVGVAGWYFLKAENPVAEANAPTKTPVATVTTVSAKQMNVPIRLDANGYVSSLNSVEIRPQVTNVVAKVHIKEGQFVKAGDLLFSLDDRADRVNLQMAQAQLAKDQAGLADLERQLARSKELLAKGFIAQSATDTVQTQVEAQRAALQADKAAVEAARVALGYDSIRATSAGRAGVIAVFPGSLVQPTATAVPLVTISQLDPIAVTFTLPETELNALLAAQKTGDVKVHAKVQGAQSQLEGKLSFIDNTVDTQNGTIKVKAIFPNAEHLLWPGQYVAVNTVVRELGNAIVIPQSAIITGIDAKSVYTVGADQTAQPRRVELLYSFATQAAVKGIQAGERVVVDGKQNLRPGTKVREAEASNNGNDRGNDIGAKGTQKSAS
ncbi:efflux RND transporter periplasmic adaptor subunit [Noviherbaspirillum cavernae]|uniref:Efflux RND transporter periplasmic adaptor subunit n=1 Tax=Noviherbaspirillum cavernae TaxID=2320862 RepID=A0A418X3C5_9BURK|nr:efflux RND transporter periplasmic adaptor subunit [Noviherbaspirillum cavernae]RJG06891.1 efflux RND transporter periplasmic adaptor subunit [Noviherbaspirillum cavernae]